MDAAEPQPSPAYRDRFDAIETAVDDERELRRLGRQVARDDELEPAERSFLADRVAFYVADQYERGGLDLLAPEQPR